MPRLMLDGPKGHGGTGPGVRGALDRALRRWRGGGGATAGAAETRVTAELEPIPADFAAEAALPLEDSDLQKAPPSSPSRPSSAWKKARRTLLPVAAVAWSVCHLEAAASPVDVCWRSALLCWLWAALGGCVYLLLHYLRSPLPPGGAAPGIQEGVVSKSETTVCERPRSPDVLVALGLVLADSLLVSVLQEPLPGPGGPHVLDLLCRLEAVSNTLDTPDPVPDVTTRSQVLTDKVTLVRTYLQQRTTSLRRLVRVQAAFEAGVKELQEGVEVRWDQLEVLHAGVTLTKEEGQGNRDLASTCNDAETLFAVLSHHRSQLDRCQELLKDGTQLLQELTWTHSRVRTCASSSGGESAWPEVMLQSNMEQFDKAQESFQSLEQQTSTFRAHLEGLAAGRASSSPSLDPNSDVSSDHWESSTTADSDGEPGGESDSRLSLCERSALKVTSTFGRLRKPRKKK